MCTHLLTTLLLTFLTTLAHSTPDQTLDIFLWPLTAPHPQNLAKITHNTTHARILQTHTPAPSPADEITRLGFHHNNTWSGIATAATNFLPGRGGKILLHLDDEGARVYHLGFQANPAGKDLEAEVVRMARGPTPRLNRPVVLNAEGRVDEGGKEGEKTFIQKYWWVIGAFLLLQVVMGGGKE